MEQDTKVHELKTWTELYQQVKSGAKNFELRKNDRNFQVGDILHLREWINKGYSDVSPNEIIGDYTGDELFVAVTYILKVRPEYAGVFGLNADFCIMSIHKISADWISVKDNPPIRQGRVLLLTSSSDVRIGDLYGEDAWRVDGVDWDYDGTKWVSGLKYEDVTHWQPLPAPPTH